MTLITTMRTATPSMTPTIEMRVMTETNVRLGRKYRSARNNSNGSRDIRQRLVRRGRSVNEPAARGTGKRVCWTMRTSAIASEPMLSSRHPAAGGQSFIGPGSNQAEDEMGGDDWPFGPRPVHGAQ